MISLKLAVNQRCCTIRKDSTARGQGPRRPLKNHGKHLSSRTSAKTVRQDDKTIRWYEKLVKHKLVFTVLMLGLSYLLGVWLRTLPAFSEQHVLTGDDPYLHLRYAEYMLENGSLPSNDTLRYYPEGFDPRQELLLVSWFIALFSRLTGLQPLDVAIWLPAFFAPLIVIPVYFISKEITGSRTSGVIAAFLAASAPGFIFRTFEGFCDKETFTTPFMYLALVLALVSFNIIAKGAAGNYKRKLMYSIVLATLSGTLIGTSSLGWAGFLFAYLVLAAYALLVMLFGEDPRNLSLIFFPYLIILMTSGAFAALLTARYGGLSFFWSITFLAPVGVSLPLIALRWLKRRFVVPLMVVLVVAVVIVEWNRVAGLIDLLFGSKGLVRSTVAESQQPTPLDVWNQVGFPLIPAILALLPMGVKDPESRNKYLFLLSMFAVSAILAYAETRLLMFLSLTASIMAGVTLSRIVDYCGSKLFLKKKRRFELNRKALGGLALSVALVAIVILSLFAIPTYSIRDGPIVNHATIYREICMSGHTYWLQALDWLKENTSSNAIIISWWDYGYLIQYYANRTTVVDPGNVYEWRNVEVARFFMSSDEYDALNILNKSFGLGDKEVYVLVSFEEIPKSSAITTIAGLRPTYDIIQDLIRRQGLSGYLTPSFLSIWLPLSYPNATLTKLVSGTGIAIFQLEYIKSLLSSESNILLNPQLAKEAQEILKAIEEAQDIPKCFEKVYYNQYIAIYRVTWKLA